MAQSQPVETASAFILGVLVWAGTVNFLRGGKPRFHGWVKAKFLNEPMVVSK